TKMESGIDRAKVPGSGAAGGLGFGLATFAGGRLEPGFGLFSQKSKIDRRLTEKDLVITGAGGIYHSKIKGESAGRIGEKCRKIKIPCVALAGVVHADARLRQNFTQCRSLLNITTSREAIGRPDFWLERLASQVAQTLLSS